MSVVFIAKFDAQLNTSLVSVYMPVNNKKRYLHYTPSMYSVFQL